MPATSPPNVKVAVIINSFNRRNLLEKALGSLIPALRALPFGTTTIVFDAGSTDGSREFLRRASAENPEARIEILTPAAGDDTSFSAGVNAACKQALDQFPDLRWLMLYETDNWIAGPEPLLRACALLSAEPQLAAAGFTVRLHDGKRCGFGVRFPTVTSFIAGQNLTARWKLDAARGTECRHTGDIEWFTCDVVFTSPLLIRRDAWEASHGFDAGTFPFSDSDLDWAWRCARMGWRMAVIESDAVVHDNLAVASAWSANRVVDFHRSRLRLLKRHRGRWVTAIKPLLFLRHLIESALLKRAARGDLTAVPKLDKRREMMRTVWRNYEG
ncbi:hypothetical protein LBMAG57_36040 [Verrucomicrobiota bacterium]|nr:hypothetical protein LBMAG57_36040 [Verrucomicrobiota bacterium]